MPIYEFEDASTGKIVELNLAVADRDRVPEHLKRITVPRKILLFGMEGQGELSQEDEVMKGFKEVESQLGTREFERQMGKRSKELKKIWQQ